MVPIFTIWLQSLELLRPNKIRTFFLITLQAAMRNYALMLKHYFILYLMVLIFAYFRYAPALSALNQEEFRLFVQIVFLIFFLNFMLLFIMYARSSTKDKDTWLTLEYDKYPVQILINLLLYVLPLYLLPLYLFVIFFFFDSARNFQGFIASIINAFKMIIYNAPILVLFYVPIGFLVSYLKQTGLGILLICLMFPFFVTLLMTFYQKRLYQNFTLYKIT